VIGDFAFEAGCIFLFLFLILSLNPPIGQVLESRKASAVTAFPLLSAAKYPISRATPGYFSFFLSSSF